MFCNRCGARADDDQRYCSACGHALVAPDPVTRADVEPVDPDADPAAVPDRAAASHAGDAPPAGDGEPAMSDLTPASLRRLYDFAEDEPDDLTAPLLVPLAPPAAGTAVAPAGTTTLEHPVTDAATTQPTRTVTSTQEMPVLAEAAPHRPRARLAVTTVVGVAAAAVTVVSFAFDVVRVESDAADPEFAVGTWRVDDLASNLVGAAVLAVVAIAIGAVGAVFHQRWAAGLAGGAGLALAGWAALVIGLAEQPLQLATTIVDRPSPVPFTVSITRDVGYGVVIAAGVLGALAFVVSLASARSDRRPGLDPWLAALGAVAAIVAAAGPLIPEAGATFENNWSSAGGVVDQPTAYFVGRLVQVGLLAVSGVIGFLLVRRYGLGLAIGGLTVAGWLTLTMLLEITSTPVGPADRNPGSIDGDLHAVTIVGMTALVGLAVVAVIAAIDQAAHER